MPKQILLVVGLLCFALPNLLFSQDINTIWEQQNRQRTKQLEEFWERFNNKFRQTNQLVELFDQHYLQQADSNKRQAIKDFVQEMIVDSTQILSYTDSAWYAELDVKASLNKKEIALKLYLKPQKSKEGYFKWVIFAAKSPIWELKVEDSTQSITPVSHNLNFMQLSQVSQNNPKNICALAWEGFKEDNLSIFFYLVQSQQLKIAHTQQIVYHFGQLKNWSLKVQHFERKEANVGWLISSIEKK